MALTSSSLRRSAFSHARVSRRSSTTPGEVEESARDGGDGDAVVGGGIGSGQGAGLMQTYAGTASPAAASDGDVHLRAVHLQQPPERRGA